MSDFSAPSPAPLHRHGEIDAIRGVVILLVLLGSFGTRYQAMIGHLGPRPAIGYPVVGYIATQLFFAVSAYRRLIELTETRSGWRYTVACVQRYAPSLWASVALIWLLGAAGLGLQAIPASALPANLAMAADLVGTPLIDPAHWRLKIEFLLWVGAGLIWFALGRRHLAGCLGGLLVLALLGATGAEPVRHPGWTVLGLLNLDGYLPHCAFGMALCQLIAQRGSQAGTRMSWLAIMAFGGVLAVAGNAPEHRAIMLAVLAAFGAAAYGALPFLARIPVLPWLGRVALPIFVVHLTPGFALIGALERSGCPVSLAMLAASLLAVALGVMLERWAERPAARAILWAHAALAARPIRLAPLVRGPVLLSREAA